MAKKHKNQNSRKEKRQGFFGLIKSLAAILFQFASFILIILEIIKILKNW